MASSREPTLGVHLLETITKGMYSEPLHSVREYVQNAYDSIRSARRNGLLATDAGEVRVAVDTEARTVRIRDDGTGLGPEEAAVYLLDLGNSNKVESDAGSMRNAGFRGIGRMAGITYCKKLRFETSNGNGKKCIVEFDATGINRLTRAGQKATTIVNAIRDNSMLVEETEDQGQHYLEVVLDGINNAGESFLKEYYLEGYLAQTAPVDYNPEWSFGDKIRSIAGEAESESSLDHIRVTIRDAAGNRRSDVRRPFRNTFKTTNRQGAQRTVRVKDVVALPRDGNPVEGWWGWLALHERQGALANIPFAGLQVRMHNIAVGDVVVVRELFTTPSHAMWCFGEVHVTDSTLTPNAQRDNFEDSRAWRRIKERLRNEAVQIDKEIRRESAQRSVSVETLKRRADAKRKEADRAIERGFVSPDEQKALVRKIQEEVKRLAQDEGKRNRGEEEKETIRTIRRELEDVAKRVESVTTTKADAAQAHLSRETRRVLRRVREVLQSELDEETFRRITEKINAALQPGQRN